MEEEPTSTEITAEEVESSETENPADFSVELSYKSEEDEGGNPSAQAHEHVPVPGYNNTPYQTGSVSTDGQSSLDSWPIFRIPGHLRELDERAYTPRVVSIGPLHRNDQNLKQMEAHKQRLLKCLLDRFNQPGCLETAMQKLEMEAWKCYSEAFQNITGRDFVEMMLLDGCFILELMRLCYKKNYKKEEVEDPIFDSRWLLPAIRLDLLKLENQLPMFVLQELFYLTISDEDDAPLSTFALRFFQPLRLGKDEMIAEDSLLQGRCHRRRPCSHHHLLALFQSSFTLSTTTTTSPPARAKSKKQYDPLEGKSWVNNATSLRSSGISFQSMQGRPLDIEFKWGVLKIPTLFVDDKTVTVLRNLMVYEQRSKHEAKPYFTTLAVFFCCIAAIPGDISILREAGIIQHEPGTDDKVVNVLSPLCKEIEYDMDDCYIARQVEAIDDYTRSRLVKLWIGLKRLIKNNSVRLLLTYIAIVQSISLHSLGVKPKTQ